MVDRLAALQQGDLRLGAGGLKLGQGLFRLSLLDALSVENADKLASALLALLGQLSRAVSMDFSVPKSWLSTSSR